MEDIIEESSIDKLNDDCLALIFEQLPTIKDLSRMEMVSKRWRKVASYAWKRRRFLAFTEDTEKNWGSPLKTLHSRLKVTAIRSILRKCGHGLRGLETAHSCVFTRIVLENIGSFCPNLNTIRVRSTTNVNLDHLFSLGECKKIRQFSIVHLVDESFLIKILSILRNLRSLTIEGDEECCLKIALLKLPTTLEELHLCNVDISGELFRQAIPRLTKLRVITINCCNNINPEVLEILSTVESLRSVKLAGRLLYTKAPQMARFICSLKNLDELDVSLLNNKRLGRSMVGGIQSLVFICCWCCSTQPSKAITDHILSIIAVNCPKLKSLTITGPFEITDAGFGTFVQLEELRTLKLQYCWTITDKALGNLSNLHNVSLLGCRLLSDSGIVKLIKQSPELRTLNVLFTHAAMATILTAIDIAAKRTSIPFTLFIDYRQKQNVAEYIDNYPKPPLFKFAAYSCT